MRLRRRWYWWAMAVLYVWLSMLSMPYVEKFLSPFEFHVFQGPR